MSLHKALEMFQTIDVSIAMLEESEYCCICCCEYACTFVHSIHSTSTPYTLHPTPTPTPRWDRSTQCYLQESQSGEAVDTDLL